MLGHAFFFACVLVLSLLSPLSPHAATSYWKVSTSNPASDMWDNGLSVFFNLDTKQCEKKYGEEWPQMCDAPAFGEINAAADGVVMTPSVPGSWALDWAHEPAFFSTEAAAARYGVQH